VGISVLSISAVPRVLGVLCGFSDQRWESTAEDAEDAEEHID
jgi:hypothetical protein